jgi:hypothetical protein
MKKAVFIAITILCPIIIFTACQKKNFHCTCTYNQKVVYTEDLGYQEEDKAREACSANDTTYAGQLWHCTIF